MKISSLRLLITTTMILAFGGSLVYGDPPKGTHRSPDPPGSGDGGGGNMLCVPISPSTMGSSNVAGGVYMNSTSNVDVEIYSIVIHTNSSINPTANGLCGDWSVNIIDSGSIRLEPADGSRSVTLKANAEVYLGWKTFLFPDGSEPRVTFDFSWTYPTLQGPSSLMSGDLGQWKMGGSNDCNYSFWYKASNKNWWSQVGSSGEYSRIMSTDPAVTNFKLLAVYSCGVWNNVGSQITVSKEFGTSNKSAAVSIDPIVIEDVSFVDSASSSSVIVSPNYPNPFNPTTRIEFELLSEQEVDLSVYNVTGQKVATLMSGVLNEGTHSAAFNAEGLPNGTYMYVLTHAEGQVVNRMTLLK